MSRAEERLRRQRELVTPVYERPNEAPVDRTTVPAADRCATSTLDGQHDFSSFSNDDPPGSGLRTARCWFCRKVSPRSQARIDAWEAGR